MKKFLYQVEAVGPITLEAGDETVRAYPVRKLRLKKHGKWEWESFYGTASLKDAMIDLHPGDLIVCDLSFHAYKIKGRWEQHVSFDHIVKLKEVD